MSTERLASAAGVLYVALFVGAFGMGIEVGKSDEAIREYYADSGHRTKELIAFFLIAAAALAFLMFADALRRVVTRGIDATAGLTALAWAGAVGYAILVLAGNAVSRATAFASMDDEFQLDPNGRRLLEDAGLLLLASGAIVATLFVVGVSVLALRSGTLPKWLAWAGFAVAALLPLAIGFIGFLALFLWVLAVSITLAVRRPQVSAAGQSPR